MSYKSLEELEVYKAAKEFRKKISVLIKVIFMAQSASAQLLFRIRPLE